MGIQVHCPNGHTFKVKDKYAGKKGLCPKCVGQQVVVQVPEVTDETATAFREAVLSEHRAEHAAPIPSAPNAESVFDDHPAKADASTSASLIGSSVIKHKTKCECGAKVPMWYAKCPGCGRFLEHR